MLESVLCHDPPPIAEGLAIQDKRGKSERKPRWRGGEILTTQPNQRLLQVRYNGRGARIEAKYTLTDYENQTFDILVPSWRSRLFINDEVYDISRVAHCAGCV